MEDDEDVKSRRNAMKPSRAISAEFSPLGRFQRCATEIPQSCTGKSPQKRCEGFSAVKPVGKRDYFKMACYYNLKQKRLTPHWARVFTTVSANANSTREATEGHAYEWKRASLILRLNNRNHTSLHESSPSIGWELIFIEAYGRKGFDPRELSSCNPRVNGTGTFAPIATTPSPLSLL